MFDRGSRYEDVPTVIYTSPTGRQIEYKRLRRITDAPALQTHTVELGDRLDHIAARYFGDPLQFGRIADANLALLPEELVEEVGRRLLIPFVQR